MIKKTLRRLTNWNFLQRKAKTIPFFDWLDRNMKVKALAVRLERFHALPVGTREEDGTLKPAEVKHSDFMDLYRLAKDQQELLSRKIS